MIITVWKNAARILCASAVAIGLAACAMFPGSDPTSRADGGAATGAAAPAVETVPELLVSVDLRLPLDDYLWSVEDLERISRARRVLISRCMHRFGVEVALPDPVSGIGPRSWMHRRYGLTDPKEAATLGYGLGRRDPSRQPRETDRALSPHALAVLTGESSRHPHGWDVPPGGCSGTAQRVLDGRGSGGDRQADLYLAQRLSMESFERSRRDSRVVDAFKAWSTCMQDAGHSYDDPLAPFDDGSLKGDPAQAVDTATDDVTCKRRTNLVGIWYAVESAYQTTLIEDHRAALTTLAAANATTDDVVRQVLGGRDDRRRSGS